MTTVAYRAGILATDSQATWGDGAKSKCVKMWRLVSKVEPVRGPILLAIAGDLYGALLFHDWLQEGGKPNLHDRGVDKDFDFDALIVHKSGVFTANFLCRPDAMPDEFWAHGSGRHAALGAMHAGKSAIDAVRIATRVDPYSGGRIVTMQLDEPRQPRRQRKGKA